VAEARFLTSAFGRSGWPPSDAPEVAFVGRSNVGKSSCLNTLVGQTKLARVSKTPGRTQSINFFDLGTADKPLRFADLPGYGFAKVPAAVKRNWDGMIGEYLVERDVLRLVVILVDLRRDPTDLDRHMVEWLERAGRPGLLVMTKADRISKSRRVGQQAAICKGLGVPREASMLYSSHEAIGRKELWRRIHEATR
jgi:GTP-binding protein